MKKKLLSLFAALMMVLCLCSTALAANSPNELDVPYTSPSPTELDCPYAKATATAEEGLNNGEELVINSSKITMYNCTEEEFDAAKTLVNNEEKVVDALIESGVNVPADAEMVLVSAGDYSAYLYYTNGEEYQREEYTKPLTLTLNLADLNSDAKDGDTVFVLHYNAKGEWEVYECVVENGSVTLDLESLSPILVYKMMSDGTTTPVEPDLTVPEETTPSEETTTATTTTTTSAATTSSADRTSPYTGS